MSKENVFIYKNTMEEKMSEYRTVQDIWKEVIKAKDIHEKLMGELFRMYDSFKTKIE